MATFPPILWLLVRYPTATLAASFTVYAIARGFQWNIPSYPDGAWYFNPFAWQFLFVIGACVSLDRSGAVSWLIRSRTALYLAALFLLFSLAITLGARFGLASPTTGSLLAMYIPNDKTNLATYRIVHFLSMALIAAHLIPRDSPFLTLRVLRPAMICGEHSLEVFCAGIFLAFVATFLIDLVSSSPFFQLLVSVGGIASMTAVAAYKTWIKDVRSTPSVRPVRSA